MPKLRSAVRAWSDQGLSAGLARAQLLLSFVFFAGAVIYVRAQPRAAPPR